MGIFDPWKNMVAVTKNKTGQTEGFGIYLKTVGFCRTLSIFEMILILRRTKVLVRVVRQLHVRFIALEM